MHRIRGEKKIGSPYEILFPFIWDIKTWSSFWSPLKEVEVLYDDGRHQEFLIDVSWEGGIVPVRTVRYRENNGDISFFSPVPPPPTTFHTGLWKFEECKDCSVNLIAEREFICQDKDSREFTMRFEDRINALLNKIEEKCRTLT